MTAISWTGALLALDGLLVLLARGRSPARLRPRRFLFCILASVPIWLSFDWINFGFLGAWDYHGLPESLAHRYTGYFFAFGAICPAMFLFAQLYQELGLARLEGRPLALGGRLDAAVMGLGALCLAYPFVARDPSGTSTLWLAWLLLLDPLNRRLGAPSLLGDWAAGRWGRTLALIAAGLTCGLLWELWNYWAAAKWTYHLPFLGPLERWRYFEMPLAGLLGFPPFALECWAMFQTTLLAAGRCGLQLREQPPAERDVL